MKLDDLHKKNIYKVPEGYFDELPGRIQKKIQTEKPAYLIPVFNWSLAFKIVTPIATVIILLVLFVIKPTPDNPTQLTYEQILDEVSTEEMVSYLEIDGITSFEILENMDAEGLEYIGEELDDNFLNSQETIDDELMDAIMEEYDFEIDNI